MPAEQLWLDVERPIQPTPRREPRRRGQIGAPGAASQMELLMADPAPSPIEAPAAMVEPTPPVIADPHFTASTPEPFGIWLLAQASQRGALGALAKAAKLDRLFPRDGDADGVRARFSVAGADGDAFEALDDAEREYGRQAA